MSQPKSFTLDISVANGEYIEILNGSNSVGMHSGRVVLEPGKEVGKHSTGNHEELIMVLHGEGKLETEGVGKTIIRAGMVAYNPPQTEHNVINTGSEVLAYIYVVAPVHESR
jgi:quercetin dioxygenase-like cupin family protein